MSSKFGLTYEMKIGILITFAHLITFLILLCCIIVVIMM